MIVAQNISKNYKTVQALQKVSVSVQTGELFGIIGPDGAGKTTLFRILTTLLKPTTGTATVNGYDVVTQYKSIRQSVGYMPGKFSLYPDLTVQENLQFFATIFGTTVAQNYDLIKDIYSQIEPFKNRRAGALSGGMKQKLALSCALIHKPKVLFLDEPTTGVDPVSRQEFWQMLLRLKQKGITILVSTPYMDEASLCDRIALLKNGQIHQQNTPQNLIQQHQQPLYALQAQQLYPLLLDLQQWEQTQSVFAFGESLHWTPKNPTINTQTLYNQFQNHPQLHIQPIKPTIEDIFMTPLTKQKKQ